MKRYVLSSMMKDYDTDELILTTASYENDNLHRVIYSAVRLAAGDRHIVPSSIMVHYVKTSENGIIERNPSSKKYDFDNEKNYLNTVLEIANDV